MGETLVVMVLLWEVLMVPLWEVLMVPSELTLGNQIIVNAIVIKYTFLTTSSTSENKQYWPAFVFAPCAMIIAGFLTIPLKFQHIKEQKLKKQTEKDNQVQDS